MVARIVLYTALNIVVCLLLMCIGAKVMTGHFGVHTLVKFFPFTFFPVFCVTCVWILIAWQMELRGNIRIWVPFLLLAVYLFYGASKGNFSPAVLLFPVQFAYSLYMLKALVKEPKKH